MAMTHDDSDFIIPGVKDSFEGVNKKIIELQAKLMTEQKRNVITAGGENEKERIQIVGQFYIAQRPNDPLNFLRISVGEPNDGKLVFGEPQSYLTFRGNPQDCIELLERALNAFRASHFEQMGSQL